jgi:hypothetical protein
MSGATKRRRGHGDGGVFEYTSKAGDTRFRISWYEPVDPGDDTSRQVRRWRRGFTSYREAQAAVQAQQVQARAGESTIRARTSPTVSTHMREWIEAHRVEASTRAGYRRLARLHVYPYIGHLPLRKVTPLTLAGLYLKLEMGMPCMSAAQDAASAWPLRWLATVGRHRPHRNAWRRANPDGKKWRQELRPVPRRIM